MSATPFNDFAAAQYREVERIWPTPAGRDPSERQALALVEEVGEIARGLLKRSHAQRSATGVHKGKTVDEWTTNVHEEIGQAIGVLLGLAHVEGVDLDATMADTIDALLNRPSIVAGTAPSAPTLALEGDQP